MRKQIKHSAAKLSFKEIQTMAKHRFYYFYLTFYILVSLYFLTVLSCSHNDLPKSSKALAPEEKTRIKIESLLAKLTIEEKVGQLFIIGGNWQTQSAFDQFALYHFGNAYLGTTDVGTKTPEQVRLLTERMQSLALEHNQQLPLLIFTDQEGGLVNRLKKGFTVFPSQEQMAKLSLEELTRSARTTAQQLHKAGVNANLAPVIDIRNNPQSHIVKHRRSFSADPLKVAECARIYIEAFRAEQILACVKHFPNDGDIDNDPHNLLAINPKSKVELLTSSLIPYQQLIKNGQLQMIMVSHVRVPALEPDPTLPASLSKKIIAGFIRQELKFKGVVVIDEMNMKALGGGQHPDEKRIVSATRQAIAAGIDLLFFTGPERLHIAAYKTLVKAFTENELSVDRLNESVRRILSLKTFISQF
jgi:beta-N-acetylhexosaminidase